MTIFLTGATGYVGAHVAALLLENHRDNLNLLVRASDAHEAEVRLWRALQLHFAAISPIKNSGCQTTTIAAWSIQPIRLYIARRRSTGRAKRLV
jgi:nucleoside-diphosphate-sugar epimerase